MLKIIMHQLKKGIVSSHYSELHVSEHYRSSLLKVNIGAFAMSAAESGKSGEKPEPPISSGWSTFRLFITVMGKDAGLILLNWMAQTPDTAKCFVLS